MMWHKGEVYKPKEHYLRAGEGLTDSASAIAAAVISVFNPAHNWCVDVLTIHCTDFAGSTPDDAMRLTHAVLERLGALQKWDGFCSVHFKIGDEKWYHAAWSKAGKHAGMMSFSICGYLDKGCNEANMGPALSAAKAKPKEEPQLLDCHPLHWEAAMFKRYNPGKVLPPYMLEKYYRHVLNKRDPNGCVLAFGKHPYPSLGDAVLAKIAQKNTVREPLPSLTRHALLEVANEK